MISYGLVNYATFACTISRSPGWRPTFKYYNHWLSLVGTIACVVIMFIMDWVYSLVSCALGLGLFVYLQFVKPQVSWGPAGEART